MKLGSNLDLGQNQIQNPVLHPLSAAPSSPKAGQFYYSTASNVGFVFNGTAWRPADAAALSDGSIAISALATNPLVRGNHTGTQLANTISNLASTVQAYSLSSFAGPTGNIAMAGYTLTGLSTAPNAAGQAAEYSWTLAQIQSAAAGIASKPPVRAVATSNLTLSGTQTVDGVALAVGDRVLAAAQSTASQNGVYIVSSGAWSRATGQGATGEIESGALWLTTEGTNYAGTQWRVATTGAITVGTTALSIVQYSAGSPYTAGNGLVLTGTAFSINVASGGGILASGSGIQIDTSIVARKASGTITGDGSTTAFQFAHGLGTTDVVVQAFDASGNFVLVDTTRTSTSVATLTFGQAPASGVAYRVTAVG
ncbi:hypothetical protein [Methylobacterium sp. B1]|uniref:hypothetical protein n=1 Tax=Methylobacterium sp. B1 TaxID=91459 RepID=UPI00034D677C|nr:hypothetical protein [Methylobacterium sp. B1]